MRDSSLYRRALLVACSCCPALAGEPCRNMKEFRRAHRDRIAKAHLRGSIYRATEASGPSALASSTRQSSHLLTRGTW